MSINKRATPEPTVARAEAIAIDEEDLKNEPAHSGELAILDENIEELDWMWLVPWSTRAFRDTGDFLHCIFGSGPRLVDKVTGEVLQTGSRTDIPALIRKHERARGYRRWWKF